MKNSNLYIAFLFMLATYMLSCGCEEPVIYTNRTSIDPAFIEIYLAYKIDMQHYGYTSEPNHLSISFSNSFGKFGQVGVCQISEDKEDDVHAAIQIGRQYWNDQGPLTQKVLLYHELTHCLFYIGHSGKYGDIMFDDMKSVEVYWQQHIEDQTRKLFTVVIPEALEN